jgi:two-component system sensor histidine kinase ChvG
VFDRDGNLLVDSRDFFFRGNIRRQDLPPLQSEGTTLLERSWNSFKRRFGRVELPVSDELSTSKMYPEVMRALQQAKTATVVRINSKGQTFVFVAVPIQRFKIVRGALLLSTQEGDIDQVIARERVGILLVFGIASVVILLLSILLAGTIAEPIRRLADAAERVRRGSKSRQQIPDYSARSDEIGHLSVALREMTRSLYSRIEAIESFAADVAHELKNPLTSLRSAVETLPLARNEESRARLLAVVEHDVRRLDRLISDISDASRLDAELGRFDAEPINVARVLETVVSVADGLKHECGVSVVLEVKPSNLGNDAYLVMGQDSRLGQVFNNLIDNARSFSEPGASVRVICSRNGDMVQVIVDDDGPGIPERALTRIFERFYTDRPDQGFGQNSGLGLSISRQIVEAHRGRIVAQNRVRKGTGETPGEVLGARFVVTLPALAGRSDA